MKIRGLAVVALVVLAGCSSQVAGTALPDTCGQWETAARQLEASPDQAGVDRLKTVAGRATGHLSDLMGIAAGYAPAIVEMDDKDAGVAFFAYLIQVQDACAANGRVIVYGEAFQRG